MFKKLLKFVVEYGLSWHTFKFRGWKLTFVRKILFIGGGRGVYSGTANSIGTSGGEFNVFKNPVRALIVLWKIATAPMPEGILTDWWVKKFASLVKTNTYFDVAVWKWVIRNRKKVEGVLKEDWIYADSK